MIASRFIDTNVIVYAYDSSDPEKQKQAQSVLADAARTGDGATSVQVLSEFFHTVVIKRKLMQSEQASAIISTLKQALTVANVTEADVDDAILIHQRFQLRYWDSLIVSVAKRLRCAAVVSEDLSHSQDYGGVRIFNPFQR